MKDLEAELTLFEEQLGLRKDISSETERPLIMVVDDDHGYLSSLVEILKIDHEVIACSSGPEALAKVDRMVQVVVLDIKMPGMNGLEVYEAIKKKHKYIPIIFNTGYPGEYLEKEIEKDFKPFAYVTKDNPRILLAHLNSALKHHRLCRDYFAIIKNLETANQELQREIAEHARAKKALRTKERELAEQARTLQDLNTTLRVLIENRDMEIAELEKNMLATLKKVVLPFANKLRNTKLNADQQAYLDIMESNLAKLASSFARHLSSPEFGLTPAELEVAELIKAGRSTKEIAEILHSSEHTINFHRKNIRKKLGIKSKSVNLQAYFWSRLQ